jgi:hypothetical protein
LIARNEETRLPACLESIAGIAHEIIVVDTGSADFVSLFSFSPLRKKRPHRYEKGFFP